MIAYFDTSAIVPLLIREPTSDQCASLWDESTRIVSVRLAYTETCAALAQANRMGRLTPAQMDSSIAELDDLVDQVDMVEITDGLARDAGKLASEHGLRGYDAVHLAAAMSIADDDTVFVTGDRTLAMAAQSAGLATAVPTDSRRRGAGQ